MNVQKIIELDRALVALRSRLGPVLAEDMREALDNAERLSGEVRHFAVSWADSEEAGKARALVNGQELGTAIREVRQACIDRLIQVVRPD